MKNYKTKKINEGAEKKIYIQYNVDEKLTTLSFRSTKSLNKHIETYKINKENIKLFDKNPNTRQAPTVSQILNTISYFGNSYGEDFVVFK